MRNRLSYRRLLAARVLSEANDLKRDPAMLAADLNMPSSELARLLQGECEADELLALIDKFAEAYPVDGADLRLAEDDCIRGVRVVRGRESIASSRIALRRDAAGQSSEYYEYRDTAFSRLSPFRPEWIRPLRLVSDASPQNDDVQFNQGHLLHQYTFYVGEVNFYCKAGERICGEEMSTGDSTYGTPWWPHTFTARDPERRGYILAVTFGSHVRNAQRELYWLGERTRRYAVEYRKPRRALVQLLEHHLANEMLTREEFARVCTAQGLPLDISRLFDETRDVPLADLESAARALRIESWDLLMPAYTPESEVVVERRRTAEPRFFPAKSARYRLWPMARLSRMPQVKGFGVDVSSAVDALEPSLCCGLHSWVYNYGNAPVAVVWHDGDELSRTELAPHDSMYIQPFIRHAFSKLEEEGHLCVVRVPGLVDLATQRELSYLSEVDRVFFEDRVWY